MFFKEQAKIESELIAQPEILLSSQGEQLLSAIEGYISRFVILPVGTLLPITLWVLASHVYQVFETFPYLAIVSPTKRAGKTQLLRTLEVLSRESLRCTFPSPAVLYRVVHERKPTLLLDEVEFLSGRKSDYTQALIAILDAGFETGGMVPRCGGPKGDRLNYFSVFCPKAFAAIGRLPDTLADRSIVLHMQRKAKNEKASRFSRQARQEGKGLKEEISSYLKIIEPDIVEAYGALPDLEFLQDREADCWLPIFSLCSVVNPSRLDELRRAAQQLCGQKAAADVDDSIHMRLLTDIRSVWPEKEEKIFSGLLKDRLCELEESPWKTEYQLTPNKFARMVREFGIPTGNSVRIGDRTAKGYYRRDFEPAFSRYLNAEVSHPSQPACELPESGFCEVAQPENVTPRRSG